MEAGSTARVWKDGRLQEADRNDAALASLCQAVERAMRQHPNAGVRAVILMVDQPGGAPGTGGRAGPGVRRCVRVRLQPGLGLRLRRLAVRPARADCCGLRPGDRFEERHPGAQLRADLLDLMIALALALRLEPAALRLARQLLRVRA